MIPVEMLGSRDRTVNAPPALPTGITLRPHQKLVRLLFLGLSLRPHQELVRAIFSVNASVYLSLQTHLGKQHVTDRDYSLLDCIDDRHPESLHLPENQADQHLH